MKTRQSPAMAGRSTGSISKKKLFVIWGVAFFVAVWMFGLGVLVGRGTAPVHFDMEKLQNELAALKQAVQNEEKNRLTPSSEKLSKGDNLEFYEALKSSSNTPQRKLRRPQATKPTVPVRRQPTPRGRLTVQVASLKDARTADQIVAQLKARGFPAYRAIGKIPGKGIWYRVRVGAFNDRAEAQKMLKRLDEQHYKGILVNQ